MPFEIVRCVEDGLSSSCHLHWVEPPVAVLLFGGRKKGALGDFLGRLLSEQRAHFEPATSSGPATCRAAVLKAKRYSRANKQLNEMSSRLHPASLDSCVRAAKGLLQSCRACLGLLWGSSQSLAQGRGLLKFAQGDL